MFQDGGQIVAESFFCPTKVQEKCSPEVFDEHMRQD